VPALAVASALVPVPVERRWRHYHCAASDFSVEVHIEASSIETGLDPRDADLRSKNFLYAERFPQLVFKSKRGEKLDEKRFRLVGELTIRGNTREIVLDAQFGGRVRDPYGNERVAFTATTSLDRKDYGLTWNQALETGGVVVGDRVDIEIEIQAIKEFVKEAA